MFHTLKVLNYRLTKLDDKTMKDKGTDKTVALQIIQKSLSETLMFSRVSFKGTRNEENIYRICFSKLLKI